MRNKSVARFAAALMCSVGLVAVGELSAQAAGGGGGNCQADRQKDSQFGPDEYRVRAGCTQIDRNRKARGVLVRDNQFDEHTQWFTTENRFYYSPWDDCPFGCYATYQFGAV